MRAALKPVQATTFSNAPSPLACCTGSVKHVTSASLQTLGRQDTFSKPQRYLADERRRKPDLHRTPRPSAKPMLSQQHTAGLQVTVKQQEYSSVQRFARPIHAWHCYVTVRLMHTYPEILHHPSRMFALCLKHSDRGLPDKWGGSRRIKPVCLQEISHALVLAEAVYRVVSVGEAAASQFYREAMMEPKPYPQPQQRSSPSAIWWSPEGSPQR